jgi:hypothetical protein
MKKLILCTVVFFSFLFVTAFSPLPDGHEYNAYIYFKNASSHNVLMVFYFAEDSSGFGHKQLCLEKTDIVTANTSYFAYKDFVYNEQYKTIVNPNVYCKKIQFYDIDSGEFLNELTVKDTTFVETRSSTEGNYYAFFFFELSISDEFFSGGE